MNKVTPLTVLLILCAYILTAQNNNIILEYNTDIRLENKKLVEEHSVLIQVNDKESAWISDVKIAYKADEKIKILEAAIVDENNHIIRELKNNEVLKKNDSSEESFFEDNYILEFKLKWHTYPYRIKYKYSIIKKDYFFIANWKPLIFSNTPIKKASLDIYLPSDYQTNLDYSSFFTFTSDTLNKEHIFHWKIENVKEVREQIKSPPIPDLVPSIKVIPIHFNYVKKGSFESWTSFGQWQYEVNQGLDELSEPEKKTVDQLLKDINNPKEKIKILYEYLQRNTRHVNIEMGKDEEKPSPASYTSEKKYGDSKALTIYMKALLKYAGIESFYTKIYSGKNPPKVNKFFPSQQFNHVILCVPLENDTIWLENTASYFRPNYLGTLTQNRFGLVINDSQSKLVKTSSLTLKDVYTKTRIQLHLDIEGKGRAIFSGEYGGEEYENLCRLKYESSYKDQISGITNLVQLKNFEINNWNLYQGENDETRFKLEMELDVKNQVTKIGPNIIFPPTSIGVPKFEEIDLRIYPVQINYPVNRKMHIEYYFSLFDFVNIKLPENFSIKNKFGSYSQEFHVEEKKIILVKTFQLNNGHYSLKEYPEFYSFIEDILDIEKRSSIILSFK